MASGGKQKNKRMCLYPRLVRNPKYKPNKKNGGNVPHMADARVGYVPVGCGLCFECMKKKSNEWKVRLSEEIRTNETGQFVTLTFSNESYAELAKEIKAEGYALDNEIATVAVRRFLERWRKKEKKSVRHWLITELGSGGTENIHLHGIIFTKKPGQIAEAWKYGYVWVGDYVNEATINYVIKYVTKTDIKHKAYKPKILCSPGIGRNYTERPDSKKNKFSEETDETYKTRQGKKMALPIYYRNKLYNEEQREKLWLKKLDKNERWVGGEKVRADDEKGYEALLEYYRKINKEMGYGSPVDRDAIEYEEARRKLIQLKRINSKSAKPLHGTGESPQISEG